MEGSVASAEGRVCDEPAPELAHERGAYEALRLPRLDAEEDLSDEVVHQLRRRPATEGTATVVLADVAGRRLRWRHGDPAHRCRERSETEGFRSKGATRKRSQLL